MGKNITVGNEKEIKKLQNLIKELGIRSNKQRFKTRLTLEEQIQRKASSCLSTQFEHSQLTKALDSTSQSINKLNREKRKYFAEASHYWRPRRRFRTRINITASPGKASTWNVKFKFSSILMKGQLAARIAIMRSSNYTTRKINRR